MSSKPQAERLSRALESTGLTEPVNVSFSDNRVAVLCRIHKDNEQKWLTLVSNIMIAAIDEAKEIHAWQTHICRNYFIKETEDRERKLVWGWNVSIHSTEMQHSLDVVIKIIKGQTYRTSSKHEVDEFPLGSDLKSNAPKNGRGVHTIGGSQDFHVGRK